MMLDQFCRCRCCGRHLVVTALCACIVASEVAPATHWLYEAADMPHVHPPEAPALIQEQVSIMAHPAPLATTWGYQNPTSHRATGTAVI